MSKPKKRKDKEKTLKFLHAELDVLDQITVNDQVEDSLKRSAPDIHETIRLHLLRRIRHLS